MRIVVIIWLSAVIRQRLHRGTALEEVYGGDYSIVSHPLATASLWASIKHFAIRLELQCRGHPSLSFIKSSFTCMHDFMVHTVDLLYLKPCSEQAEKAEYLA